MILFMNQSEQTMEEGQSKGNQAMQALQRITQGTDEAASQTEEFFVDKRAVRNQPSNGRKHEPNFECDASVGVV